MPGRKRSHRILVIDDSTLVCKTIVATLEPQGYTLQTASSGEEALEILSRWLPDAILCDIVMPGMDGYEFCRRVRGRERLRSIPIILLTSRTDPRDKVKGLDIGAADYVTKPFDPGELRARVAAHLRIVTLQKELRGRNRLLTQMRRQLEEKVQALSVLEARRQKSLDLAYKVQLGLLPGTGPAIDGFEFFSRFLPADDIAGDFYDYIPLDNGRWGIAIGDVAGKGLPASLLMVLTKTLLRTEALRELPPSEVLENVNRLVINHYGSAEAVTLFYGVLDPATNSFTFSNGGHEYPLLYSARPRRCAELSVGGPFLGIFPDAKYNEARVYLGEDDLLLLYTDGLYHVPVNGKPIGTERALRDLLLEDVESGRPVLQSLLSSPRRGGDDDVTLIAMRSKRSQPASEVGYVRIHNSDSSLKDVRDFTAIVASTLCLAQEESYNLVYSIDEAVANAVAYAYERPFSGLVEVFFTRERTERRLRTDVVDYGKGSPADAIDRKGGELDGNPLQPRGRGFVLMDNLMDSCDIIQTPGGGTTIRMTKRLPPT